MITTFFDRQLESNPLNGAQLNPAEALEAVLRSVNGRDPFFFELIGENGKSLLVGVGAESGSAQYSSVNGMPPYLMVVGPEVAAEDEFVEFLMADTLTPVPIRYKVSRKTVDAVAKHFLKTGERASDLPWEEI